MKKKILIILMTSILLGIVIVNTMADPSHIVPRDLHKNEQISNSAVSASDSVENAGDEAIGKSNSGNNSKLLSLLMIGLILAGLANFRGGNKDRRPDRRLRT